MFAEDKHFGPALLAVWRFARGDTAVADFEGWLYADQSVERLLGGELYFRCISANYRSAEAVCALRESLTDVVLSAPDTPDCACVGLPHLAVVDMGEHEATFRTLIEVVDRGVPWWWLSLHECGECGESWLVAAEERQNDIYILRRLDAAVASAIVKTCAWPADFETYEELLRIGLKAGRSVRHAEPFDSSLSATIEDLARQRPGIRAEVIARLLNTDEELVAIIVKRLGDSIATKIDFNDA